MQLLPTFPPSTTTIAVGPWSDYVAVSGKCHVSWQNGIKEVCILHSAVAGARSQPIGPGAGSSFMSFAELALPRPPPHLERESFTYSCTRRGRQKTEVCINPELTGKGGTLAEGTTGTWVSFVFGESDAPTTFPCSESAVAESNFVA